MSKPAARQGDKIVATDIHITLIPAAAGAPVPTPLPYPFNGPLTINLSTNVFINGKPAATVGSQASNMPPHIPQGGSFATPPTNMGQVTMGSTRVLINNKPAARQGDLAQTCSDVPVPAQVMVIPGGQPVLIGD
jgi:uncharacterized Zn-binding protein involved in type VI secretion